MKRHNTAMALATVFFSGAALAADLPSRKAAFEPPPQPPAFAWSGVYAGLDLGAGWLASGGSNVGVSGGGLLGYNHRIGPLFVVGLETDFQGTSLSGRGGGADPLGLRPAEGPRTLPWFGTVRGRAGVTGFDSRVLFYGTGGFAYGETSGAVREGWTAGAGVEWAFAPHWSAKTEYLFTDLGKGGGDPGALRGGADFHTVRVGVNYHFDLSKLPGGAR
ncbi:porin family protein [Methylosinus sp. H3A]|uniref:outer membrane protein n=1 Tax=Methylosinus sp. H3A TaxID=2785786 RepID=UPI0018C33A75|nr:outer membrane protein [Methylosinus sp. H3A]MBG0809676.1 porin family protein [Methylosinus sp. H3A]